MKSSPIEKKTRTSLLGSLTLFSLLTITVLLFSCDGLPDEVDPTLVQDGDRVHVAFAGGGWRAHTGHSAWIISLLGGEKDSLGTAFENVTTVSSNSGGSWFSTMLMFSEDFNNKIQASDAIDTWANSGWLGQQEAHFNYAGENGHLEDPLKTCKDYKGQDFLECVVNYWASGGKYVDDGGYYWNRVTEKLVFKDYQINESLNGTRQTWAAGKPLLLAASLLTNEVVLNGVDELSKDQGFYQACIPPTVPKVFSASNSSDSAFSYCDPRSPDVTPVTFSSIPASSTFSAPPFFSALGLGNGAKSISLIYSANKKDANQHTATIQNEENGTPLNNDEVPVMIAAAASSAAVGFAASKSVLNETWEDSYYDSDEALSFMLKDSKVTFNIPASSVETKELADDKYVRIADGGPVDNSGVSQIVGFLQQNDSANNFHIIAFDNVQAYIPSDSLNGAPAVGTDIAYLFGLGLTGPDSNQFCSGLNGTGVCVEVPDLQIFNQSALYSKPKRGWTATDTTAPSGETHQVIYTPYSVTTIDNSTFGISKGTQGTLHSFTCIWSDAGTAPENSSKDADFKAYAAMLKFINSSLNAGDKEGLKKLKAAFGLSN